VSYFFCGSRFGDFLLGLLGKKGLCGLGAKEQTKTWIFLEGGF